MKTNISLLGFVGEPVPESERLFFTAQGRMQLIQTDSGETESENSILEDGAEEAVEFIY